MAPVKTALILHYQMKGTWPKGSHTQIHDELGIAGRNDLGGDYVRRIMVRDNDPNPNSIRVIFFNSPPVNDLIRGKYFELQPTVSSGVITSWKCVTNEGNRNWIDQEYISSCD